MNNETKKGGVPRLRFPEFAGAGEWEEEPLEDLIDFVSRRNRDKTINRVFTNSAAHGIVDQRDFFDKDIATKGNTHNYFVVEFGDYVYNPRISETAPVGPTSRNKLGQGIVSPLYTVFRFRNPSNDFYEHYFKSTHWERRLQTIGNKGARHDRMSIGVTQFLQVDVLAPSLAEQQKIAACLSSLDETIGAEGEKWEALKAHKRGLMQGLFPREGEPVPRLRFAGFEGEWVEGTLGDAAIFLNGRAYQQSELLDSGKYRVLRVGNFFSNNEWYYSNLELEENKYCDKGDLLYAWSASFGPRIWTGEKVIYHYHIWKVLAKEGIAKQFLFVLLDYETDRIKATQANGLGMMHITKGAIEAWKCRIPADESEQQKIADTLSSLDALIAAQAQRIAALKEHKRGLMQGLFPSASGDVGNKSTGVRPGYFPKS